MSFPSRIIHDIQLWEIEGVMTRIGTQRVYVTFNKVRRNAKII